VDHPSVKYVQDPEFHLSFPTRTGGKTTPNIPQNSNLILLLTTLSECL